MGSENVEVVRLLLEAYERDDVAIDAFNVYTLRNGKVTRMEFFTSREPALRAAGLAQSPTESEEST